jgi:hypothetical protein
MIEWSKVTYFESEAKGFVHTVLRSQELEILPSAMIILLPLLRGGSAGSNSRGSPASASMVRTSNECACTGNSKYIPREITTQRPGCLTIDNWGFPSSWHRLCCCPAAGQISDEKAFCTLAVFSPTCSCTDAGAP